MSVGRSDSPWPSRSSVSTRWPRSASARASASCMWRLNSRPCSSTTVRAALAVRAVRQPPAGVGEAPVHTLHGGHSRVPGCPDRQFDRSSPVTSTPSTTSASTPSATSRGGSTSGPSLPGRWRRRGSASAALLSTDPGGAWVAEQGGEVRRLRRWRSSARASGGCRCSSCDPTRSRPASAASCWPAPARTAPARAAGSCSPRAIPGRCAATPGSGCACTRRSRPAGARAA